MAVAAEIHQKLEAAFAPSDLEVIDESAMHAGHAGAPEGGESHFRVRIASDQFTEMTRIARHRAIHSALGAELMGRIHALALDIRV